MTARKKAQTFYADADIENFLESDDIPQHSKSRIINKAIREWLLYRNKTAKFEENLEGRVELLERQMAQLHRCV